MDDVSLADCLTSKTHCAISTYYVLRPTVLILLVVHTIVGDYHGPTVSPRLPRVVLLASVSAAMIVIAPVPVQVVHAPVHVRCGW